MSEPQHRTPRLQALMVHLHDLGPRAMLEVYIHVEAGMPLLEAVEIFCGIAPDDWAAAVDELPTRSGAPRRALKVIKGGRQ
jgi:hypothetical protein